MLLWLIIFCLTLRRRRCEELQLGALGDPPCLSPSAAGREGTQALVRSMELVSGSPLTYCFKCSKVSRIFKGLDVTCVRGSRAAVLLEEAERRRKEAAALPPRDVRPVVVVINPCDGVQCAVQLDGGSAGVPAQPLPPRPPSPPRPPAHALRIDRRGRSSAPTRVLYLW